MPNTPDSKKSHSEIPPARDSQLEIVTPEPTEEDLGENHEIVKRILKEGEELPWVKQPRESDRGQA